MIPLDTTLYERLRLQGYTPRTMLDIGANVGMFTWSFLQVYPTCKPTMVEPNPYCEEDLQKLPFERHMVAASNENGEAELFLTTAWLKSTGSSLYRENSEHFRDEVVVRQPVPKARLDDLLAGRQFDFVKIDTQGAELDVLQGGRDVIAKADYVMIEISLADYNPGAGRAEEIIDALASMGFVTTETLALFRWQGEPDGKVVQMDCIFERRVPRPSQGGAFAPYNDTGGLAPFLQDQKQRNWNFSVLRIGAATPELSDLATASVGDQGGQAQTHFAGDLNSETTWRAVLDHVARHGRFSYAICPHVIQRMADPDLLLRMLPLVAEAGFLSAPARYMELSKPEGPYRGFLDSRWLLDPFEDRLTLAPKLGLMEYMILENEAAVTQYGPSEYQVTWRGGLDVQRLFESGQSPQQMIGRYSAFLDRP
jgi:FkbM family methyltransferase